MDFSLSTAIHLWTTKVFSFVVSPQQRLYWPFLLSSLLIALMITAYRQSDFNFKELMTKIFSKEGLFHPSSLLDFKLFALNSCLKLFLFPVFLFSVASISMGTYKLLFKTFPNFSSLGLSPLQQSIAATLMAFLISDFLRFFTHYLMHEVPGLRNIHRTHHSAEVLTPMTLYRVHPLESFVGSSRNILTQGLFLGFYAFFFGGKISAIDILGVNAVGFVFNALGSNLRHCPVPISFGWLEYIFISPRLHQLHHSAQREHNSKNHGVALSIWDQLFGTFYRPSDEEMNAIAYGLSRRPNKEKQKEAREFIPALFRPIEFLNPFKHNNAKGVEHEKSFVSTGRS